MSSFVKHENAKCQVLATPTTGTLLISNTGALLTLPFLATTANQLRVRILPYYANEAKQGQLHKERLLLNISGLPLLSHRKH